MQKIRRLLESNPPDGEELIFHERDIIISLLMYHHRSGIEYILPALQYVELRFGKLLLFLSYVCIYSVFCVLSLQVSRDQIRFMKRSLSCTCGNSSN